MGGTGRAGLGVLVLWVLYWWAGLDILGELVVWVLNWGCEGWTGGLDGGNWESWGCRG